MFDWVHFECYWNGNYEKQINDIKYINTQLFVYFKSNLPIIFQKAKPLADKRCKYGMLGAIKPNHCWRMLKSQFIFPANLAKHKRASQSSNRFTDQGDASKAVDGNTNGHWSSRTCTHTTDDLYPWWSVDLGEVSNIFSVFIKNRVDCCCK